MTIDDIFTQLDIEDCSVSNSYNKILDLASLAFTYDEFTDSEKKALYIELCSMYNQFNKKR